MPLGNRHCLCVCVFNPCKTSLFLHLDISLTLSSHYCVFKNFQILFPSLTSFMICLLLTQDIYSLGALIFVERNCIIKAFSYDYLRIKSLWMQSTIYPNS